MCHEKLGGTSRRHRSTASNRPRPCVRRAERILALEAGLRHRHIRRYRGVGQHVVFERDVAAQRKPVAIEAPVAAVGGDRPIIPTGDTTVDAAIGDVVLCSNHASVSFGWLSLAEIPLLLFGGSAGNGSGRDSYCIIGRSYAMDGGWSLRVLELDPASM